jgi:hypothetical protein
LPATDRTPTSGRWSLVGPLHATASLPWSLGGSRRSIAGGDWQSPAGHGRSLFVQTSYTPASYKLYFFIYFCGKFFASSTKPPLTKFCKWVIGNLLNPKHEKSWAPTMYFLQIRISWDQVEKIQFLI